MTSIPRVARVAALLGTMTLFFALPASASAACGAPVTAGGVTTVTCTPGVGQVVNVPDHFGPVTLSASGAFGGVTPLMPYSGSGGTIRGNWVHNGPFGLTVDVATKGANGAAGGAGGIPGGGAGATFGGAGGGGYSRVVDGATTVLIAAGGGGSGTSSQQGGGGNGGGGNSGNYLTNGAPGGLCGASFPCLFPAGGGATTTAAGAGESHGAPGEVVGQDGAGSTGGAGGATSGGGGAGGGCFGGGGGGTSMNGPAAGGGGGGGGSSCADAAVTNQTTFAPPQGDGRVAISYVAPAAAAITSPGSANFTLGASGSYQLTASGAPTPTVSLDNPAALPAGVTFNAGAGTISGTPSESGTFSVTVRANNGVGTDATQTLVVNVAPPSGTLSRGGGFVSIGGGSAFRSTSRGVNVQIACRGAAGTTCKGTVAVSVRAQVKAGKVVKVLSAAVGKKKRLVVGKAKYTVRAGSLKVVKVKLNRRGRKLLKQFRTLRVAVRVSVTAANGERKLATKKVKIKARRNRR